MSKDISQYNQKNKYEKKYLDQGYKYIAGIDEVGRGPLAGRVYCAVVILNPDIPIYGLKDSKKLSKIKINILQEQIKKNCLDYAISYCEVQTIDKIGIKNAVILAMKKAVNKLKIRPNIVLVDYEKVDFNELESIAIKHGDDLSNSIAAASIIAKYERDKYMFKKSLKYPEYGFETNVGYGTKKHLEAIKVHGPIKKLHRFSFKPMREE